MNHLPQFKSWLELKHYSSSTIRNYLADLGKYLEYVNHLPEVVSLDEVLSSAVIKQYVSYLSDKNNSSRYLASLRKYCQFALDQKLILSDPFRNISRQPAAPNLTELVNLYQQHLAQHHTPLSTIRNYINDLTQYITWLSNPSVSSATETSPLDKGDLKPIQKRRLFNFWPPLPARPIGGSRGGGQQAGGV